MRKFLILAGLFVAFLITEAQNPLFLKDDKLLNLGVGMRGYPLVSGSLDYCIVDGILETGSIGVGPFIGMGIGIGINNYKGSYLTAGARSTFHYSIIDNLDTYFGVGLGLQFSNYEYGGSERSIFRGSGIFLGANYPLTENILLFGELGSGVAYLNVGITLFL
ncbi:MAG: hypothetical protein ACERKD_22640 [Prolixibacteraceae bacterium]